mmetsp:Transcript_11849/g.15410  ORF Transcript_11849/g.15410 Transcript_11849/m.15410 type:complete len:104 (+) Transcript_11849:302-613(+)
MVHRLIKKRLHCAPEPGCAATFISPLLGKNGRIRLMKKKRGTWTRREIRSIGATVFPPQRNSNACIAKFGKLSGTNGLPMVSVAASLSKGCNATSSELIKAVN